MDDNGECLSHVAIIIHKYNLNGTFADILSIQLAIPRDFKDLLLQQHMSGQLLLKGSTDNFGHVDFFVEPFG